jgi:isopentenyl phosphate kinase
MLILKLGGAAITDKTRANTANREGIRQIAKRLAAYRQPILLIHGAGSFGHIIAEQHDLQHGHQRPEQLPALVRLQQDLHTLNQIVVDALVEAGLPSVPIHPASMCVMENGRLVSLFMEPIERALKLDLIPVLYGDCVWDRAQTFGIISGDQLAVYLANELKADRLAFGTNVDGVLDADGKVITRLPLGAQITDQTQGPRRSDVTGGMMGKLDEISHLNNPSARTWIFNLQKLDVLEKVLAGNEQAGTLVVFED